MSCTISDADKRQREVDCTAEFCMAIAFQADERSQIVL
jgi:hypothetical protein